MSRAATPTLYRRFSTEKGCVLPARGKLVPGGGYHDPRPSKSCGKRLVMRADFPGTRLVFLQQLLCHRTTSHEMALHPSVLVREKETRNFPGRRRAGGKNWKGSGNAIASNGKKLATWQTNYASCRSTQSWPPWCTSPIGGLLVLIG